MGTKKNYRNGTVEKVEKFEIHVMSLKAITVDHEIQSRVKMDPEHQHDISEGLLRGDTPPPIVVFFDGKTYWLADGFHRHAAALVCANTDRKFEGIRCEVRPGTRRDAIIFSTKDVGKGSLKRTKEDKANAVRMLLNDEEWFNISDKMISRHIGINYSNVQKIRLEFCTEKGIPVPLMVDRSDGRSVPYSVAKDRSIIIRRDGSGQLRASIPGMGSRHLGRDLERAKEKIDDIVSNADAKRINTINIFKNIDRWLIARKILVRSGGHGSQGFGEAFVGNGFVIVGMEDSESPGLWPNAVGRVLLNRKRHCPDGRAIICVSRHMDYSVIPVVRELGIEIYTPDELVAALKGEEGEAGGSMCPNEEIPIVKH